MSRSYESQLLGLGRFFITETEPGIESTYRKVSVESESVQLSTFASNKSYK